MRSTCRTLCTALLAVALAACSGGQGAGEVTEAASPAPVSASPAPVASPAPDRATPSAPAAAFEGSTETVSTDGFPDAQVDGIAYLTAVRAGRHATFDRVVWTFDGQAPAYRVGYARRPITEDGSGRTIEVDGDAVLQVIFTPASGTDLSGETPRPIYAGDRRLAGARFGTTMVREIVETGDFEATMGWAVGLERRAPFTVTELSNPTRIVVDIASGRS
jgi:hypothetical protein